MLQQFRAMVSIAIAVASHGCDRLGGHDEVGAARAIDSFVPREEALRRFQQNLTPVTRLQSPYGRRDSLLAAFIHALSARDTAAIVAMAVTPAEFAYLYYPTTPQSLPPYDLEPGLMWQLLRQRSERGIRRALAVYGGQRLELLSHDCGPGSSREGRNTIVGPCTLRLRDQAGQGVSVRLVTQIMERNGRYKVLSYANSR